MRITREGFYYLVIMSFIIGGAMLRDLNLLMVVAGIMFGLFLLNGLSIIRSLNGLSVDRKSPDIVTAGDLLVIEVTLINRRSSRCSWAVQVEDSIRRVESAVRESATGKVLFPCIRPKQTMQCAYHGRITQRGRYELGPLRISTRFPLGLLRRTKRVHTRGRITVYPKPGELLPAWYAYAAATQLGSQRARNRQGFTEGEFHGLRDWRSGDSRNWIHWRTTAKRGELTVRQFERHENQDIMLLADIRLDPRKLVPSGEDAERVIRFAATIAADQCRRGNSRLFVGVTGVSLKHATGAASTITLHDAMEVLSLAEASTEDRLPELLNIALSHCRPDTRIIIIGTSPIDLSDTERFADAWDDLEKRVALGRITCINIASPEVGQLIRLE